MPSAAANALAGETSPYLQQHATNPVQWLPWNAAALQRARVEDKPILLSIGYSACHWCHVMAHESFEDPATADLMNAHFINIKVDREERPDLDRIYQAAHHLLTRRSGGWPLTMFLTPHDQMPFFGGTYFPNHDRYGMPSFRYVLQQVAEAYRDRRPAIDDQNQQLGEALTSLQPARAAGEVMVNDAPLLESIREAEGSFDAVDGGFGSAPKFPHPESIERLLRHAVTDLPSADSALHMAAFTLSSMARGGLFDQLGGGFCRYSVDARWMIPHFEKMLYDNGPLLAACAHAWQVTGEPLFKATALATARWVMDDMQSQAGGFYSSRDADSEGEEGRYYVWTPSEAAEHLDDDEYQVFVRRYGLDRPPNFEGAWHLFSSAELEQIADDLQIDTAVAAARLAAARDKLLQVRSERVAPGRDEKVLTSWNALMIKGMAIAGQVFAADALYDSAARALDFVRRVMWRDGRLLATSKDGQAHLNAYLDDYAYLLDALLTMLESRWRPGDLEFATALADALLEYFEDRDGGGFFFTSHDHEKLIQRSKSFQDDALPSGNGIAAFALGRLGHLLGEARYLQAAERTLQAAWPMLERFPWAHNAMLLALEDYLAPPRLIVIRAPENALPAWREACGGGFQPRRLVVGIPNETGELPGLLRERGPADPGAAFICSGHACEAPVTSLDALRTRCAAAASASD